MSFDYEYDPRADAVEPEWSETPEYENIMAGGFDVMDADDEIVLRPKCVPFHTSKYEFTLKSCSFSAIEDSVIGIIKGHYEKQRELDGIADAGHALDERREDDQI